MEEEEEREVNTYPACIQRSAGNMGILGTWEKEAGTSAGRLREGRAEEGNGGEKVGGWNKGESKECEKRKNAEQGKFRESQSP